MSTALVVAVMDEDGQEVELAFPESFFNLHYTVVVKRYDDENNVVQKDVTLGLNLLGAATIRENLVATYKADGFLWVGDTVWQKPDVPGYTAIYIGVDERQVEIEKSRAQSENEKSRSVV